MLHCICANLARFEPLLAAISVFSGHSSLLQRDRAKLMQGV